MKFSFFSLRGSDIFNTPFGAALNSLSTVTHASVTSTDLLHGVAYRRTLAALTPKLLRPLTLTMTVALPSSDNLIGTPLVATTS